MLRLVLAIAALFALTLWGVTTALSATACFSLSGSGATLQPTQAPDAAAEVQFKNTGNDAANEDLFCELAMNGLTLGVQLTLGRGGSPDTLTVAPPTGFVAVPWELTIGDGTAGVVLVYPEGRLIGF